MAADWVRKPDSIIALTVALKELPSDGCIVAGGTDLVIRLRQQRTEPTGYLVLGAVPEMKRVEKRADHYWIGASVTMSELERYSFPLPFGAIHDAASEIGSKQIRNIATIGGNIANGSAASDFQPVLAVLNAAAVILDSDGNQQEEAIMSLIKGSEQTDLSNSEVILGFRLPYKESKRTISLYRKLGYRRRISVTRIGLAMNVEFDKKMLTIQDASISVGAVFWKAIPAVAAAAILQNQRLDTLDEERFFVSLEELVRAHSPRQYKSWAIRGLAMDALELLRERMQPPNC